MKKFFIALLFIAGLTGLVGAVQPAYAAETTEQALCRGAGGTWDGTACTKEGDTRTVSGLFKNIANVLVFIVGAISVVFIIVGGLKYATSQGDSSSLSSAKNTILYAIIGLVIALMSYAVVNFVLRNF